jgi:hypothetical protein
MPEEYAILNRHTEGELAFDPIGASDNELQLARQMEE